MTENQSEQPGATAAEPQTEASPLNEQPGATTESEPEQRTESVPEQELEVGGNSVCLPPALFQYEHLPEGSVSRQLVAALADAARLIEAVAPAEFRDTAVGRLATLAEEAARL